MKKICDFYVDASKLPERIAVEFDSDEMSRADVEKAVDAFIRERIRKSVLIEYRQTLEERYGSDVVPLEVGGLRCVPLNRGGEVGDGRYYEYEISYNGSRRLVVKACDDEEAQEIVERIVDSGELDYRKIDDWHCWDSYCAERALLDDVKLEPGAVRYETEEGKEYFW